MPYELIDNNGIKTLSYTDGSRTLKLHSAYSPEKEAQRSVDSFKVRPTGYIVVAGMALGYHIRELCSRYPDRTIIVIERDKEVLDIARGSFPETVNSVITVSTLQELSKIFEETDITSFKGFSLYMHRPSYQIDPSFYDSVIADINRYISSKISDLLTRFEFEEKWVENIILNIPLLKKSVPVKNFFGAFNGVPGIIVSAGPSLYKSISFLKASFGKALIIAVDTAWPVLEKNGVKAHFVMTLDAQRHSIKHFFGIENNEAILIADMVSCPSIQRVFKGRTVASTTSKYYNAENGDLRRETTPFMSWMELYVEPFGDVQSGGSVATSAFDFLLNAGCSSITLVGQDLAYTGREIHATGTHHNDAWLPITNRFKNLLTINQNVIRKRKIKYITAWGGSQNVISDYVMNLYREWFADACRRVSIPVYNATGGGARIDDAIEISHNELLSLYGNISGAAPAARIEAIMKKSAPTDMKKLKAGTARILEQMKKLKEDIESPAITPTDLIDKFNRIMQDETIAEAIKPFLKKTNAYLNRNDLAPEKIAALIKTDIIRGMGMLEKFFTQAAHHL